jgi:hypothetical protein
MRPVSLNKLQSFQLSEHIRSTKLAVLNHITTQIWKFSIRQDQTLAWPGMPQKKKNQFDPLDFKLLVIVTGKKETA